MLFFKDWDVLVFRHGPVMAAALHHYTHTRLVAAAIQIILLAAAQQAAAFSMSGLAWRAVPRAGVAHRARQAGRHACTVRERSSGNSLKMQLDGDKDKAPGEASSFPSLKK